MLPADERNPIDAVAAVLPFELAGHIRNLRFDIRITILVLGDAYFGRCFTKQHLRGSAK
jgi:hypothetical protein